MKNRTLLLIGGVIIALIAAAFGVTRITQAQDNATTATTEPTYSIQDSTVVQSGELTRTISATGTISPVQEVTLSFQSQAVVTEILVAEGQRVQAGDVIARIQSRSYDQQFADAQYQLSTAQIAYNDLVGPPRDVDVAAAEASVRSAQLALGPGTPMTGPDSVAAQIEAMEYQLALNTNWQTQMRNEDFDPGLDAAWLRLIRLEEGTDEWEDARQDYYAAEARETLNQADVQSTQRGVDVAQAEYNAEVNRVETTAGSSNAYAQLTQAEIELANLLGAPDQVDLAYAEIDLALAQLNLEYVEELGQQSVLIAPFDGVITELNLTQGIIPPRDAVVITNDSGYEMVVPVDELDVAQVDEGESVSIDLDALPGTSLVGTVDNVALISTLQGDVVTYDVRIALEITDEPIRSGMSGRVWITSETVADALYVPSQFVREVESLDSSVVVVETADGSLDLRRVTLGVANSTDTQILSGVDEGETVVLLLAEDLERLVAEYEQASNANQQ
jgi:HlyD family secretion protein